MVVAGPRTRARATLPDGRRRLPRRLPRLVLTLLAVTALMLAGNSVLRGTQKHPADALASTDSVRPAVGSSPRQAAALQALLDQVGSLGRDGVKLGIERLLRDARAARDDVAVVHAHAAERDADGLVLTALTSRVKALEAFEATLSGQFESGPPEQAVDALVNVGRDLAVSDRAYELFLDALPAKARASMPPSAWLPDPNRYGRPEMSAFVATLRANASLAPVHDLSVITVTVDPAPVGTDEPTKALVLPLNKTMKLQVIVANAGNAAEKHVPVEAVATSTGGLDTARQFVDLDPGQRMTVGLTVRPSPVGTIELRVRVGPANGEVSIADNEQVSQYVMR